MSMPRRKSRAEPPITLDTMDPWVRMWRALTPRERSVRAWRLRSRLKNIEAIHDAKSLPKL
jgi:hypothetical protein